MSRNQRLGFLGIAVVIAVAAVVAFTAGGGSDDEREAAPAAQTATPEPAETQPGETPTPTPTPTATPKPQPPLLTSAGVKELEFEEGETVRFRVRSSKPEEIHVHGYDVYEDVPAGKTVNVSFKATITGIFEIEFHGSGQPIAELKVEPE